METRIDKKRLARELEKHKAFLEKTARSARSYRKKNKDKWVQDYCAGLRVSNPIPVSSPTSCQGSTADKSLLYSDWKKGTTEREKIALEQARAKAARVGALHKSGLQYLSDSDIICAGKKTWQMETEND